MWASQQLAFGEADASGVKSLPLVFFAKKIAGLLGEEMEVCLATDLLIQAHEKVERKGGTSVFIDLVLSFFCSSMSQYV